MTPILKIPLWNRAVQKNLIWDVIKQGRLPIYREKTRSPFNYFLKIIWYLLIKIVNSSNLVIPYLGLNPDDTKKLCKIICWVEKLSCLKNINPKFPVYFKIIFLCILAINSFGFSISRLFGSFYLFQMFYFNWFLWFLKSTKTLVS